MPEVKFCLAHNKNSSKNFDTKKNLGVDETSIFYISIIFKKSIEN